MLVEEDNSVRVDDKVVPVRVTNDIVVGITLTVTSVDVDCTVTLVLVADTTVRVSMSVLDRNTEVTDKSTIPDVVVSCNTTVWVVSCTSSDDPVAICVTGWKEVTKMRSVSAYVVSENRLCEVQRAVRSVVSSPHLVVDVSRKSEVPRYKHSSPKKVCDTTRSPLTVGHIR